MVPALRVLSDGILRSRRELAPRVAREMSLSDEQLREVLSGGQLKYDNRLGWALSQLAIVGAIDRPTRGNYLIAEAGREVLSRYPQGVREHQLNQLGEDPSSLIKPYVATRGPKPSLDTGVVSRSDATPIEQVQDGIARIHQEVAAELLERLQGKDPGFFEEAVVKLLLAMGYGGTDGRGAATQLTNDGGIDGVIDQDVLGLRRVYIQAKRYAEANPVGRPDVQGFVGALSGKADSGVFITTSRFSEGAAAYAESVPTRIILIDGKRLTDLMIRYGVGVQASETYTVVEIDEDFFA